VYALDGRYQITKSYAVTLNTSKNFRIPTFNDLYWESSGNKDLKPETSHQIELGQAFKNNSFKAELATFYITNKQLIQWRRNRISGVWSPLNIANAHQYGIESNISIQKKIRNNTFRGNATYAFTRATDLESNNQLMYVPKHKLTASLFWEYGKSKIAIQTLYNGLVYSTSDQSQEVDPYFLGNFFLEHDLFKHGDTYVVVALRINNILNTNYQNVAFRPMPNRNYTLQLNFKF